MKTRLLFTLVLLPILALVAVAPASAQQPIPGIKNTAEFRSMKNYVSNLSTKRNIPASTTRKSKFRSTLKTKRVKANAKAKSLYKRKVVRISKQDDNKERRQVKQVRQAQKSAITGLKADLASRLGSLRAKQAAAIARASASFNSRIQPLSNKRRILQKRLDKTKNPLKRNRITLKINSVQRQINTLVNARTSKANEVKSKYDLRIGNLNDLYDARVQKARASAAKQIQQARNAYKRLFREQLATAREKKSNNIELITNLRDRGAGYIDAMPNV